MTETRGKSRSSWKFPKRLAFSRNQSTSWIDQAGLMRYLFFADYQKTYVAILERMSGCILKCFSHLKAIPQNEELWNDYIDKNPVNRCIQVSAELSHHEVTCDSRLLRTSSSPNLWPQFPKNAVLKNGWILN